MLELDEDEGSLGDVADLSGAERDALEGAPALGLRAKPRSPRQRSEHSSALRAVARGTGPVWLAGGTVGLCLPARAWLSQWRGMLPL